MFIENEKYDDKHKYLMNYYEYIKSDEMQKRINIHNKVTFYKFSNNTKTKNKGDE